MKKIKDDMIWIYYVYWKIETERGKGMDWVSQVQEGKRQKKRSKNNVRIDGWVEQIKLSVADVDTTES